MSTPHITLQELHNRLIEVGNHVEIGGRYAHYKDQTKQYLVRAFGIIEETQEVGIVYEAQYDEHLLFIRPYSTWLEKVEWEGKTTPRFVKL